MEERKTMITGGKSFVSSPPAFSNDAKRLLVCTGNTVSVFSTSTGLQTCELEGHAAQVTSVIVLPASTPASKVLCYCWTASLDGKIKYWDFAAPELMRTIDIGFPIHSMVIPSLLSQNHTAECSGKSPDVFAYIYTEDTKPSEQKPNSLGGQIQKCNLTKSRLVGGITLAKTKRPGSIMISPLGKCIGIYEKRKLRIWEIPEKDSEQVGYNKIRLHHTKSFTALAFHPTERMVAAGDVSGRILVWRGVGRRTVLKVNKLTNGDLNEDAEDRPGVRDDDDADLCTTWHWHSAEVNVLFFSSDGANLFSGGREGVLVIWQLDSGKKKFLPRIGSPLLYFTSSPEPSLCCISCADNRILLLRMPSMEILRSISGIKLPSSERSIVEGVGTCVVFSPTAGLIAVPTENYRVQYYSLFDDREIAEIQICERNHQPGDEITVKVTLVSVSQDGSTMTTVETRLSEEGIGNLVSLKFWACDVQSKRFSLSTVIYEPHREAGISSIAFHPNSHMAVSTSYGGDFKVWVNRYESPLKDDTLQNNSWICHAVGSYKKKPMTAAAFSGDGTVLAVAAENVITLWDPDRNTLLAVLGDGLEATTNLSFVGKSEYLVSSSRGSNPRLRIWCMSKLCMIWTYRLDVEDIVCSKDGSTFAVLALTRPAKSMESTEVIVQNMEGLILVFNVENPVPLTTWFVSKVHGGRVSFLSSRPGTEGEAAETTKTADELLVYVNGAHEFVIFNPLGEQASNFSISRQRNYGSTEETETFGYTSIYGELPTFSLKVDHTPFPAMPSEKTWRTIFSGPSHSLPPLTKLCSDYLESLLERRSAAAVE